MGLQKSSCWLKKSMMVKFVILIPKTIPGCIFKANGPIWGFRKIVLLTLRTSWQQLFMVIIIIWILKTPGTYFEHDRSNLSLSEKSTFRTSGVHLMWFWCSNSSSGVWYPTRDIRWAFLWIWKNVNLCSFSVHP